MKFKKTCKLYEKMCDSYGENCSGCPFQYKTKFSCSDWVMTHPKESLKILKHWNELYHRLFGNYKEKKG